MITRVQGASDLSDMRAYTICICFCADGGHFMSQSRQHGFPICCWYHMVLRVCRCTLHTWDIHDQACLWQAWDPSTPYIAVWPGP